jgi:hypothetical protein
MAAYIEEKQDSRVMNWNSKSASTSRTYHLFDYADTQDAILALGAYVPTDIQVATYLCSQPEYEVTPIFSDPEKTLYEGKVTWKTPDISSGGSGGSGGSSNTAKDPQEPEDNTSLTISFGTTSELIQYGLNNRNYRLSDGKWVESIGNSVGINRQNDLLPPEGVEVNRPTAIVTAKTVISKAVATPEWQRARYNQLWTSNDAVWNGLEKNHVMFTGMEMSQRSDDNWDLTYTFEYKKSTGDENGIEYFEYYTDNGTSQVAITRRNPWMIVDARYDEVKETIDDGSGYEKTVRNLNGVIVHNVYYESDFADLGMVGVD